MDVLPAISCTSLRKTFKDFWRRPRVEALRGITFTVPPGTIFALLGPNGSGKSTTIKILLGLLRPTSGTATVFGKSPTDVANKNRIGYMPEESHLYPTLTPLETLGFYAGLFQLDPHTRKTRIDQLLEMLELTHVAKRPIGEFSKGMARRVSLAQALINNPDLLILDEPTSGLDPQGARQVKDLMLALAKNGKTILVTSHLLADMEEACDHVAILHAGAILAQGHLDELLTQKEETALTFPTPDDSATLDALLVFAQNLLGQPPRQSHPHRGLEDYFLQIIRQAASTKTTAPAPAPFLHQ